MAFMIFSANSSKNCSDSIQSSLTSSYISTDSAIAECNGSDKSNQIESRHQRQQQQQHQIYGQFYLAKGSDTKKNYNNYPAVDERTPLVSAASKPSCQITISSPQNQNTIQTDRPLLTEVALDSVSLDLGIAIKNSTCLVRDANNRFGYSDGCGKLNEHEENWVSSKWILVPMLPLTLSMKVLTPLKFKTTCWTIWTFLVSVALIGGLTYISVWMVHLFGKTVGIPETIAGMTILSWGTGIPELIASIVLIKKTAQADMAICNTIGSNVIDISFCLSLPW